MCGIFGFSGPPSRAALESMAKPVIHRGPDEAGYWQDTQVSLGIRRLSIVDISSGQQPASNEANTIWAVLNGEIYNHIELRKELEAEGHRFRSDHSDTEVIPHLYEKYGIGFLERLNGMFGIALWDSRTRELHLIRDRAGIKPLFFSVINQNVYFGSEIKSILGHPAVPRRPNFRALSHYFSFKNIPSPSSAFEGIEQLRPGERLVLSKGNVTKHRWWKFEFQEDAAMSLEEAAAGVRERLNESVRLQLRSDAPFGAYLSGGLDSSAVVALASAMLDRPLKTFTMIYEDSLAGKNRDRDFARVVSKRFNTDHHEHMMRAADVKDAIPRIIESFDEPFSGTISTYFLTEFIGKHVKVALSGDGADELFGSYLNHRLAQPLARLEALRAQGRNPGAEDLEKLKPFEDQIDRLDSLLSAGDEAARRMRQYIWDESMKKRLFTAQMQDLSSGESSEALLRSYYTRAKTNDPLNRALYVDWQLLLPDQVLAFADRLSMAHSVEVRPPFLDHHLIEFCAKIPGSYKINAGRAKHVLKLAVQDLLPAKLLDRPKEGFVMPVHLWLMEHLGAFTRDLLSPESLKKHGLIEPETVTELLREHELKIKDNGYKIWNLMMFQVWWNKYFG